MKQLAKSLLRAWSTVVVLPLLLTHSVLSRLVSQDRSLLSHSQCLSLLPGVLGDRLRVAFYRYTLAECHPTATICMGVVFSKAAARVEQKTYIGPNCLLGWVHIHEDTLLAPAVQIPSGPHTHGFLDVTIPIRNQPGELRCVSVGRDCWIGAGAIVLADVADQTVVGAGSVVTKPLPARVLAGGNPARVIRPRDAASRAKQPHPTTPACTDTSAPIPSKMSASPAAAEARTH